MKDTFDLKQTKKDVLEVTFQGKILNLTELESEYEIKGEGKHIEEFLGNLYKKSKTQFLSKLEGSYFLIIKDYARKKCYLVRDKFGKKSLYYQKGNKEIIFSDKLSELINNKDVELSKLGLNLYFQFLYIPSPATIVANLFKVPSGHFIEFRQRGCRLKKYWKVNDFNEIDDPTELERQVKHRLIKAVETRINSLSEINLALSGGMDSTALLGLIKEMSTKRVRTFSVGFQSQEEYQRYNKDFFIARRTARYFGTEHHELWVEQKDFLENFETVVDFLGEPMANTTQIATYLLSRYISHYGDTYVNGDGGDVIFGLFYNYRSRFFQKIYNRFPLIFRQLLLDKIVNFLKQDSRFARKLNMKTFADWILLYACEPDEEVEKILDPDFFDKELVTRFIAKRYAAKSDNLEKNLMLYDLYGWTADESMFRAGRLAEGSGVLPISPYLDSELVKLAFKIPNRFKDSFFGNKILMKRVCKDLVPEEVRQSSKGAWMAPTSQWLRIKSWQNYFRSVVTEESTKGKLFNYWEIEKMYVEHLNKHKYNLGLLWAVLTFLVWRKNFGNIKSQARR